MFQISRTIHICYFRFHPIFFLFFISGVTDENNSEGKHLLGLFSHSQSYEACRLTKARAIYIYIYLLFIIMTLFKCFAKYLPLSKFAAFVVHGTKQGLQCNPLFIFSSALEAGCIATVQQNNSTVFLNIL